MIPSYTVLGTSSFTRQTLSFGTNFYPHSFLILIVPSFRPRWSLYPTTGTPPTLEWPIIIPDVVFSVKIPLSGARLPAARQYHPAWVFSKDNLETLEIPLLIAVYNKAHPHWNGRHGSDGCHKEHLMACMTAALPVHAVLGLETPMVGLLFDQYDVYPFLGMMEEDSGRIVVGCSSF